MRTNLTRFEPLFTEPFEDFFKRVLRPVRWEVDMPEMEIKVDVHEADAEYTVKAEIPGVRKEDIGVEIDGNVVTLRAETKQEKDVKEKGRLIRSERYYGAMSRSFTLGHEVDETKSEAKYADGILTLTLPKKVQTPVKTLAVQ